MKTAVYNHHSVHYVAVNAGSGFKARLVCDVGQGKGIQQVTIWRNGHTGPATVRVTPKIIYIKGTVFTMQVFFGFGQKQAEQWAGHWIYITKSHPSYATFADGATFGTFAGSLFPQSKLSLVKSGTLTGVRGTTLSGGITERQTIWAPSHGTPLPVKEVTTFPGLVGTDSNYMSHWNETFTVPVPANAVPIDVVAPGH